jgi:hypothetical protein
MLFSQLPVLKFPRVDDHRQKWWLLKKNGAIPRLTRNAESIDETGFSEGALCTGSSSRLGGHSQAKITTTVNGGFLLHTKTFLQ